MIMSHISVLKKEALEYLNIKKNGIYYDATYGGGGHSSEILKYDIKKLYATDKDSTVIPIENEKLEFIKSDFVDFLKNKNYEHILFDGILADFGVSNMQLTDKERGFSFQYDYYLDMRMDRNQTLDAHYVVNNYSYEDLYRIIKEFGEERFASKIASSIIRNRPLNTTYDLVEAVKKVKRGGKKGINPATQTFQAIRIEVNKELSKINEFLDLAVNRLKPGGRLVVISFHSLEDRIVKWKYIDFMKDCVCPKDLPVCVCDKVSLGKIITKKPVIPSNEEINFNPKSRSAKLRAFERF